jgi:outer membrane lipoprotein-sorting protein
VNEGLRKVGVDKNTLPVIYTPTVADALVNVKREKVYMANLGLIVTPGSITGQVIVEKEGQSSSEVIVLLLDKDGKEVKYTTTDSMGGFYIGSVAPGEYTVVVDKNYMDYKGLQMADAAGQKVIIPLVTDDFVDIEDINFTLQPKRGEVKKF